MALTVNFWTFSKKENSTAVPAGTPAQSFSCELKSDSGILSPVLEIGLPMSTNPSGWNYAQIPSYNRYYRVSDWQWSEGLWLCSLAVDPLASWKTEIGSSSHYVLRCSADHNSNAVDDFYPALAERPNYYSDSVDFGFSQSFAGGYYVIAIAAKGTGAGPVTYYILTASQVSDLVDYMLMSPTDGSGTWFDTFANMADILYRAVYSPFDYIKSCRWFPIGNASQQYNQILRFGNYEAVDLNGQAEAVGALLGRNAAVWPRYTQVLDLPSGWISLDAKYRTPPYANLYLVFNPFGVIELNPIDFADTTQIVLELLPDYMSGDALLKIYKRIANRDYFITQKTARIAVDIALTSSSADLTGVTSGIFGAAGGAIHALASTTAAGRALGILTAAGGVASIATSAVPTISGSVGASAGGARSMDGIATLIYTSTYFAAENNDDFGKPLLETRTLNTISGFIKCGDGHIQIPGYAEEIQRINEYLTGGFFYE